MYVGRNATRAHNSFFYADNHAKAGVIHMTMIALDELCLQPKVQQAGS
jgi:hypothetical protein